MSLPIEVIINASSGSVDSDYTERVLQEEFLANDILATIYFAKSGADIARFTDLALKSDARIIAAGGGDGTISSIAAQLLETNKTLGVLPLGTMNHFSKDLGIPQELAGAVRVIAENHTRKIDVGEVNGHIFINNSSIGLYPSLVRRREKQERLGRGKWAAALWASLRMFRLSPFLKVRLEIDDKHFLRKTPFVFVGNNQYAMDLYNIGRRSTLNNGKLSVYFLHRGGRWGVILLLFHTIFGRLRQWKDFEEIDTEEITILTRKKRLHVAFDGEVRTMETPLHYRIRPGALEVVVPKIEAPDAVVSSPF